MLFRRQVSVLAAEDAVDQDGRLKTNMRSYQSLWSPLEKAGHTQEEIEQAQKVQEVLNAVDAAVQQEAAVAPRFKLSKGEALLLDNYRMLHGREGYHGETLRKLWRVWIWSTGSKGIPEGLPEVGSVLEADSVVDE